MRVQAEALRQGIREDCWNAVGFAGDRSCPQLPQHGHCRNCPTYLEAAADRLDIPPPPGYLEEWTRTLAEEETPDEPDTRSALLFRIGGDWLGVPASALEEVASMRPVHPLPHRRGGALQGLVNIRGRLVVCIALERILGLPSAGNEPGASSPRQSLRERLLLFAHEGQRAVVRADAVHGLHRFSPRVLLPVPETLARSAAPYTEGVLAWESQRAALLDVGLLFHTIERSLA